MQFTPDQWRQVYEQAQRIQEVEAQAGRPASNQDFYRQAVIDVANANGVDPNVALAHNRYSDYSTPAAVPSFPNMNFSGPQGALEAQAFYNLMNAEAQQHYNRIDEVNPYGQAKYTVGPDGQITREYSLSDNQSLLNAFREERDIQLGELAKESWGQVRNQWGQPLDFASLPQAPTADQSGLPGVSALSYKNISEVPGAGDFNAERTRVADSVYDRFSRRFEPQFQQETAAFEQQMADRGIAPGSELYNRLETQMKQRQQDSRLDAASQAQVMGRGEHESLYGMAADTRQRQTGEARDIYGAQTQDRTRALGEQQVQFGQQGAVRDRAQQDLFLQRNLPFQEMQQLYGAQRGVVNPEYSPLAQVNMPGVDVAGTGLGYATLGNNYDIAKMQIDNKTDPFALASHQAALNAAQAERNYGYQQALQNDRLDGQPSSGGSGKSGFGQAAANIGGSFAGGFGNAIGQGVFR